jgi:hypothetical protein
MCPAGYPEKHMSYLYPRHKQDQSVPLLSRFSRSPSKLRLLAPALEARPQCGAKISTYPRLQSVSPERAGAHDKRVTSLPASIRKYSLRIGFRSRLEQRHGLQNTTLISCFYKKYLWKSDICILLWKYFSRQIYSYNFYICKLNNLKVIDDLYFQCLTQILSKTTSKSDTEGVCARDNRSVT